MFFCCVLTLVFAALSGDEVDEPLAAGTTVEGVFDNSAEPVATAEKLVADLATPLPTFTALPRNTIRPAQVAEAAGPRATSTARPTIRLRPTFTQVPPPATLRPTNTPKPTSTPRSTNTATPLPLPTFTLAPPTATFPPPTATLPPATATPNGVETAIVTAVIDGDTIEVNLNGSSWRVRYIGIDTPEYNERCGSEATSANAALVAGQTVTMVKDVSEIDQYGRLLRYIYVGDTFVNGELVAGGWADPIEYPPDTRLSGLLSNLAAQGASRGCSLVALPTATIVMSVPTLPPAEECSAGYSPCIPPGPDVDCAGGSGNGPRYVQGPVNVDQSHGDPYDLDRDGDGVGCE